MIHSLCWVDAPPFFSLPIISLSPVHCVSIMCVCIQYNVHTAYMCSVPQQHAGTLLVNCVIFFLRLLCFLCYCLLSYDNMVGIHFTLLYKQIKDIACTSMCMSFGYYNIKDSWVDGDNHTDAIHQHTIHWWYSLSVLHILYCTMLHIQYMAQRNILCVCNLVHNFYHFRQCVKKQTTYQH